MRATELFQDLLYFVRDPWPWGKPHEAAGIHRTSKRCSRMVARGARAAGGADAESRPAHGARERPRCTRQRPAELIRESPDLIVTEGPVPTIEAGKATPAIPIVFVQVPDPVDLGIVASLARPGRNITGFTHFELAFAGKWLETLKDMAPQTRRVLL